jgi:hypothetical protein
MALGRRAHRAARDARSRRGRGRDRSRAGVEHEGGAGTGTRLGRRRVQAQRRRAWRAVQRPGRVVLGRVVASGEREE